MTNGQKHGWGLTVLFTGWFFLIGGMLLTATFIGACLGIPLIIMGLGFTIWGAVWIYQARAQKAAEVIAQGVRAGIAQANQDARGSNTASGAPFVADQSYREIASPPETAVSHPSAAPPGATVAKAHPVGAGMRCGTCGRLYEGEFKFCTEDGTRLTAAPQDTSGSADANPR